MTQTPTELAAPWPMAFAVILTFVTLAVYFTRSYARRLRRRVRQQSKDLARDVSAFLDSRLTTAALRESVEDADPGAFWGALEPLASKLPRAEWLLLSQGLDRNHHCAQERRALRDDSPWRAELAARRLALLRTRSSRRALRKALVSGPELVSYSAARALARFGDRRSLQWLLEHPAVLRRRTSRQWVNLLRGFGTSAFDALLEAVDRCQDAPALERAIVETLGLIGDLSAAAAIERRIKSPDMEMRVAAVRALGRLRAVQCATSLLGAMKDDEWQVRAQAAWALGRAKAPVAIYALTSRLTDRSWWVRRHAAYALSELGDEGRAALAHAAETSPDPYAREMAQEVLSGGFRKRVA